MKIVLFLFGMILLLPCPSLYALTVECCDAQILFNDQPVESAEYKFNDCRMEKKDAQKKVMKHCEEKAKELNAEKPPTKIGEYSCKLLECKQQEE